MTGGRAGTPRVGIDGFNLALAQGTGVATYGRSLAEACRQLGRPIDLVYGLDVPMDAAPAERETLFFAALAHGQRRDMSPPRSAWRSLRRLLLSPHVRRLVDVPITGRIVQRGVTPALPPFDRLFNHRGLFSLGERYFRRFGRLMPVAMPAPPDIMHWTYPVPVRLVGSRNVYTIHDLVPLRLPFLSLEDKRYHERLLRACVVEAAHVLTVSERSRADILAYLPVSPERVTNTYQALRPGAFARPADGELEQTLRGVFDLKPDGYLLFVGAIEPKKNVGRLIEAYLTSALGTPLVIAGPDGWGIVDELRLLESAGGIRACQEGRIRRIGFVPERHLAHLVAGARAVVFPSLYEGFGLPVLEAMTAGAPVIVGREGALPEIAADAALHVNAYDVDALGRALIAIDSDEALRRRLRAAGAARKAEFTMARFRDRIAAVHRGMDDTSGSPPRRNATSLNLPTLEKPLDAA